MLYDAILTHDDEHGAGTVVRDHDVLRYRCLSEGKELCPKNTEGMEVDSWEMKHAVCHLIVPKCDVTGRKRKHQRGNTHLAQKKTIALQDFKLLSLPR